MSHLADIPTIGTCGLGHGCEGDFLKTGLLNQAGKLLASGMGGQFDLE